MSWLNSSWGTTQAQGQERLAGGGAAGEAGLQGCHAFHRGRPSRGTQRAHGDAAPGWRETRSPEKWRQRRAVRGGVVLPGALWALYAARTSIAASLCSSWAALSRCVKPKSSSWREASSVWRRATAGGPVTACQLGWRAHRPGGRPAASTQTRAVRRAMGRGEGDGKREGRPVWEQTGVDARQRRVGASAPICSKSWWWYAPHCSFFSSASAAALCLGDPLPASSSAAWSTATLVYASLTACSQAAANSSAVA